MTPLEDDYIMIYFNRYNTACATQVASAILVLARVLADMLEAVKGDT